jgi:hypothetical protein
MDASLQQPRTSTEAWALVLVPPSALVLLRMYM